MDPSNLYPPKLVPANESIAKQICKLDPAALLKMILTGDFKGFCLIVSKLKETYKNILLASYNSVKLLLEL